MSAPLLGSDTVALHGESLSGGERAAGAVAYGVGLVAVVVVAQALARRLAAALPSSPSVVLGALGIGFPAAIAVALFAARLASPKSTPFFVRRLLRSYPALFFAPPFGALFFALSPTLPRRLLQPFRGRRGAIVLVALALLEAAFLVLAVPLFTPVALAPAAAVFGASHVLLRSRQRRWCWWVCSLAAVASAAVAASLPIGPCLAWSIGCSLALAPMLVSPAWANLEPVDRMATATASALVVLLAYPLAFLFLPARLPAPDPRVRVLYDATKLAFWDNTATAATCAPDVYVLGAKGPSFLGLSLIDGASASRRALFPGAASDNIVSDCGEGTTWLAMMEPVRLVRMRGSDDFRVVHVRDPTPVSILHRFDGVLYAITEESRVLRLNENHWEETRTSDPVLRDFAVRMDGSIWVVGGGGMRLYSTTGEALKSFALPTGKWVRPPESREKGNLIAIGGALYVTDYWSGLLFEVDADTGEVRRSVQLGRGVRHLTHLVARDQLAVANFLTGELVFVTRPALERVGSVELGRRLRWPTATPDGRSLTAASAAGAFRIDP